MEPWIAATQRIMRAYKLPGASLAVAYEGKVVLDDGLGYADLATKQKATPTTMFRLGSVSKSLTAAVAWELVDEGKLSLTMKPFATVLSSLRGPHGAAPLDPRVRDITLGEILTMTTGFEDATDPTADSGPAERALGLHSPPNCVQAIEYELGQRLSFAPGSKYQYVNFNYCVLAEVISKVTDMSFARAAHELLTGPLHMGHTMLGAADPATLLPGEAHYYGQGYEASGPSSPSEHSLYAGQAAGGWISTASDLERFLIACSGSMPNTAPFPNVPYVQVAGQNVVGWSPPPALQQLGQAGGEWVFDGSGAGMISEVGVFGTVTYAVIANSQQPGDHDYFSALQDLAKQWTLEPQSSWPSTQLLSSLVLNSPSHPVLSAPGAAPVLANGWVWGTGASASAAIPVTGPPVPASMKPWVSAAEQVMEANNLPGASLAVAFAGREVLDVGLGYADLPTKAKVQPSSIFDIADLGRSITSAMIGVLIDEHKLSVGTKPFATVLSGLKGPHGSRPVDPRLEDITVADLLTDEGGWARAPSATTRPTCRLAG